MKKYLLAAALSIALVAGGLLLASPPDNSRIIRRAYLDILGVVPTADELDWYCVYNKNNSYRVAVEWLSTRPGVGFDGAFGGEELKKVLLSKEYVEAKSQPLDKRKIGKILLYVAGVQGVATADNIHTAKLKLIEDAMLEETGDSDIIDYMAVRLMSRATRLDEINMLLDCLRKSRKTMLEEGAWLRTLDMLLSIEDVVSK